MGNPRARILVALGASFDVVVLVTAIYFWLLVRPGIKARSSLAPITLIGILHATYMFPNSSGARVTLAALCDIGLIGFVVVQVRKGIRLRRHSTREEDPIAVIRAAIAPFFVAPFVARMFALEFGVLYYALFSWRSKAHVPSGAKAFSMHDRAGSAQLLFALAFACLVEAPPMHLIIHHWSPLCAWIETGLSIYAAIWLVGLARSIELRPVLVGPDYLEIRNGLLFQLHVPRDMISRIRPFVSGEASSGIAVPPRSQPNVCIELVRLMDAEGPFGARKHVHRVAIAMDEPLAFEQEIKGLIETPGFSTGDG
jgi:hypothetical protein